MSRATLVVGNVARCTAPPGIIAEDPSVFEAHLSSAGIIFAIFSRNDLLTDSFISLLLLVLLS